MSTPRITVIEHDARAVGATLVANAIVAADQNENLDTRVIEFAKMTELKTEIEKIKRDRDLHHIQLPSLVVIPQFPARRPSLIDNVLIPVYGHGRTRTIAIYA